MKGLNGRKKALIWAVFAILFLPVCGIVLSEVMVHLPHMPLHPGKSTTIRVLRFPHEDADGLKERQDITLWLNWMDAKGDIESILGLGESMGAAVLLQSLEKERRFAGIVAEGTYADFREVAYDRIESSMGVKSSLSTITLSPLVETGLLWERLFHGIDLHNASPLKALAANHTPILLIHSNTDSIVPLHHSIELAQQYPELIQLWQVQNARHTGAFSLNRAAFEQHVFQWIGELPGVNAARE